MVSGDFLDYTLNIICAFKYLKYLVLNEVNFTKSDNFFFKS